MLLAEQSLHTESHVVNLRPYRPLQIPCLGMTRTGTLSLVAALNSLGYDEEHHGTSTFDNNYAWEWDILSRAADATFPSLPGYQPGRTFTRAQWDEVFGPYDAVTDIASFFGPALIRAYPEAKVIIVERDIDRWEESMDLLWSTTTDLWAQVLIHTVEPLTGRVAGAATAKMITGWAGAQRPSQVRGLAREAYRRHYAEIREMVPKERLLDLKLGNWPSLCAFLGKAVPDIPFPRLNDAESFKKHLGRGYSREFKSIAQALGTKFMAVSALGVLAIFSLVLWL